MNQELQRAKQMIRPYLQSISEEALFRLAAMAQDGKCELTDTCLCIRGIVGGGTTEGYWQEHSDQALSAEQALLNIGWGAPRRMQPLEVRDAYRNRILYPMCRAEIRRRSQVSVSQEVEAEEGQLA